MPVISSGQWTKLIARYQKDANNEEGFTLVELLIVMIVIPIVVGALAFAVVSIVSLSGATTTSVSQGSNVLAVTPAFQEDAHNAIALTTCGNVDGDTTCSSTAANDAQCGPSIYPLVATFAFSNSFTSANPLPNEVPTGPIVSYVGVPINTVTTTGITAASWAAGTMKFTAINQYHVGEQVTVTGVVPADYNGHWIISAETASSFSVVNAQALTPGTSFGVVKQTLYNLLRMICTNGPSSTYSSSQVLAHSVSGTQISFLEYTCGPSSKCTLPTPVQNGAPIYSTGANWVFTGQANCDPASQAVSAIQLTITEADTISSANLVASPNRFSQLGASC